VSGAEHYARIVMDTALLRRLIHTAGEITDLAFSEPDDVTKAVDLAESKMFEVAEDRVVDSTRPIQELLNIAMDQLEENYERGDTITGAATGYDDLDELLSGLQPSTLNIVGARPAMGKTSVRVGHGDTHREALGEAGAGVLARDGTLGVDPAHPVERGQGRLDQAAHRQAQRERLVEDRPRGRPSRSAAVPRRQPAGDRDGDPGEGPAHQGAARRPRADPDRLPAADERQRQSENRQLEVSEISRNLKVLARELEVPIVALSQLSRNLEARSDKRPMLADLRESGSLEQDADVVMFLYRDEVYNPESPDKGSAEVIVSKHRSGPIGTKRLVFLGQYTRFDNAARSM
jgi:replicative DNA helicase